MPGLLRGVARTAVIAGTATSVSNRVSRRQANRWASQGDAYAPPNRAAMPPQEPPPAAPPPVAAAPAPAPQATTVDQLKDLAELRRQGVLTEEEFEAQKQRILAG